MFKSWRYEWVVVLYTDRMDTVDYDTKTAGLYSVSMPAFQYCKWGTYGIYESIHTWVQPVHPYR